MKRNLTKLEFSQKKKQTKKRLDAILKHMYPSVCQPLSACQPPNLPKCHPILIKDRFLQTHSFKCS